jgi:LysM repeat protein
MAILAHGQDRVSGVLRAAPVRRPVRRPLRLTRRGRMVLRAGAFALLVTVAVLLGLLVAQVTSADPGGAPPYRTTVVKQGDTLWGIAVRTEPDADPVDTMAEIRQLNGLAGNRIEPGQKLRLPVRE